MTSDSRQEIFFVNKSDVNLLDFQHSDIPSASLPEANKSGARQKFNSFCTKLAAT